MNQMLIQMSMDTNWGNCVDKIWDPDIPSQYLHTISYQSPGQSQEICQLSEIIQNLVQFRDNPPVLVWGGRGSSRHLQLGSTESFKPEPVSRRVLQTIDRRSCTITEKAPTRAFSWLKADTTAFTFKTLLRHYAKRVLRGPNFTSTYRGVNTHLA